MNLVLHDFSLQHLYIVICRSVGCFLSVQYKTSRRHSAFLCEVQECFSPQRAHLGIHHTVEQRNTYSILLDGCCPGSAPTSYCMSNTALYVIKYSHVSSEHKQHLTVLAENTPVTVSTDMSFSSLFRFSSQVTGLLSLFLGAELSYS